MKNSLSLAALSFSFIWPSTGYGELFLTAELIPTVGIDGFETYRITATSDWGNVVGFDFTEIGSYGVFGPLSQVNPFGQQSVFSNLNSQFGANDSSQDTQFLINGDDVISIFTKESANYLHGAFSFKGDKQRSVGNSVPFLQIASPSASAVSLKGAFAIRRPNDEIVETYIDVRLSDIRMGPAPAVTVLPVPDIIPEPVLMPDIPPVASPPIISPPVLPPISPPVLDPNPIGGLPGSVIGGTQGQLFLTAEVMPSIGRPGFDTYRLTATSNLGSVVAADFTQASSFGISGPLGQVNPAGQQTIFTNLNSNFTAIDPSQDTQFLVNNDDVLSIFTEESESSLHGAFAFIGDKQLTVGQSLPFVQISTPDASAVNLNGAFVIRRANGELIETSINVSLADIAVGPAPIVELLKIPEPIPDAVVTPPPLPDPTVVTGTDPGQDPTHSGGVIDVPKSEPTLDPQPDEYIDIVADPTTDPIVFPDSAWEIEPTDLVTLLPGGTISIDRQWVIEIGDALILDATSAVDATGIVHIWPNSLPSPDGDVTGAEIIDAEAEPRFVYTRAFTNVASLSDARTASLFSFVNFSVATASLSGLNGATVVPEPISLWLLLMGGQAAGLLARSGRSWAKYHWH